MKIEVDITHVEPVKSFLIELATIVDYMRQKSNKSVLEQRTIEAYDSLMDKE